MSSPAFEQLPSQPPEPSARREFITADRAQELLGTIGRERHRQEAWVRDLARMLEEGRFRETGDTIKVSTEGKVLDGQHRLGAIVRSGIGAWLWVVYGVDPESQDVMDRGRRRTVGDVLYMHGHAQGTLLAAAVKWVVAIGEGKLGSSGAKAKNERSSINLDPDETLQALRKYKGLEESLKVGAVVKHSAVRYPPSLAAGLHYLMSQRAGTDIADEFFDAVANGTDLKKGDPVWQLRDQLIREETRTVKHSYVTLAAWTVRAWNALVVAKKAGMPADVRVLKYYPPSFPAMEAMDAQ